MEIGIYVHIPFCIKKCYYCDFVSYANSFEMQDDYIKKLKREIEENKEYLKNNEITTIYIGGGTPSSIKEEHIKEILEKIFEVANIRNKEKLEINADNVYIVRNNSTGLTQLKDSNINQSFKDYLDYFINKTDFNENYSYFIVVELEKGNDYYYYTLKVK
mgnify:CR=1 FL=1